MTCISSLPTYLPKDLIQIILSYIEPYVSYLQTTDFREINFIPHHQLLDIFRTFLQDDQPPRVLDLLWDKCTFPKLEEIFIEAIVQGNLEMTRYFLSSLLDKRLFWERWRDHLQRKVSKSFNLDKGLNHAAYHNRGEIIKYLVLQGATGLNGSLYGAAGEGHLEIVQYLVSQGATELDRALVKSAAWGHLEVVQYLVSQGAAWSNQACRKAARFGSLEVVKYLVSQVGVSPWILNRSLANATRRGHLEVVKYLTSVGAA